MGLTAAVEVVAGADAQAVATLRDAAGAAIATYPVSATLAARVWRGDDGAVLFSPAAQWVDPTQGTVLLTFAAADTAALAPGEYPLQLAVASGGQAATRPLGVLRILEAAAAARPDWLVTAADVAAGLGEAFAAAAGLPLLIAAASRAVEDYCDRTFAYSASLDESYDGGQGRIFLRRPPVASVAAVSVAGTALDNTGGNAWTLDPDLGTLAPGPAAPGGWGIAGYGCGSACGYGIGAGPAWPCGPRTVRVQYAGGYAVIPPPVKQATLVLIKHLSDSLKTTGIYTAERIGDYEYQTAQAGPSEAMPFAARLLLGPYRLPRVG